MSDEEEEVAKVERKKRKIVRNEFIDDEAELSGDDEVSEDELDQSDDDEIDLDLVDKDAPELDSDQEEEVRNLYHKQLETEDRRAVLLLQEQLEDNDIGVGQRRRRKFKWQTNDIMENSLRRHYDPDDDDSQDDDEDDDDIDYKELKPRLRRPDAESILLGSTRIKTNNIEPSTSNGISRTTAEPIAGPSSAFSDDSNSNTLNSRLVSTTRNTVTTDLNRFLFRDKELVQALSTKEVVITTREEKDRVIQRELRRVLTSKSVFDQLYS